VRDGYDHGRHSKAFLKTATADQLPMFEAEAAGLAELAAAGAIRVPDVYDVGVRQGEAFISMEWLDLQRLSPQIESLLGTQLAHLHRCTAAQFGWHRDNTIGPTPQGNHWNPDWSDFFRRNRLEPQIDLTGKNGHRGELQDLGARLGAKLAVLFAGYRPEPSLLHGDLWAGNAAATGGEPVIYDPAVYYGDRESDIAMTRLFGGFGHGFYAAYEAEWPLAAGNEQRQKLYQLYHVLNHLNLFGRAYFEQAMGLLKDLVRTCEQSR
jgi:fructosamine-3-kinase